jgi:hypothetical protein
MDKKINMIWSRLKENRCPRPDCGKLLETHGMLSDDTTCSNPHCLFKIGTVKLESMVTAMRRKEMREYNPEENLSDLNNLEL